jgi:cytochrome b
MKLSKEMPKTPPQIWDLPLRVFHWGLMVSVMGAIITVNIGFMDGHEKTGLTVLGLVIFRLIWGCIGSPHARFSSFLVHPKAVLAYLRGRWHGERSHQPGHSPSGGYATMMILLVLLISALLGTMSHDDVLFEAPLAKFVGGFSDIASHWHHDLRVAVYGVIVAHLLALLVYRYVLKIRLAKAMVTGGEGNRPKITARHQWLGFAIMAMCLAATHSLAILI